MKSRVQIARGRFHNGYNCSQTVVCTYCDLLGITPSDGYCISEGFGGGIAQTRATCGALNALVILAGLKRSDGKDGAGETKMETYALIKEMFADFQRQNGALTCRELMGLDTGKPMRLCIDCVTDAAALAEKYLFPDLFEKE